MAIEGAAERSELKLTSPERTDPGLVELQGGALARVAKVVVGRDAHGS